MPTPPIQPPLTLTHKTMLELMSALGVKDVGEGICFGFAAMGMQAALLGDIRSFRERLDFIKQGIQEYGSVSAFVNKLKQIHFDNLTLREKIQTDLLKQMRLNPAMKDKDFYDLLEKEKDNLLVIEYQNKRNEINSRKDHYLDLQGFFSLLGVHHNLRYADVLYDNKKHNTQDVNTSFIRTLPESLIKISHPEGTKNPFDDYQEEHLVKRVGQVTAFYDLGDTTSFFRCLLNNGPPPGPLTMEILSGNHAITLVFDQKEQCWVLIDANLFPEVKSFKTTDDAYNFVIAILEAFPITDNAHQERALSTNFYCTSDSLPQVHGWFDKLSDNKQWQALHETVSQGKLNNVDFVGNTLLMAAAQEGDFACVKRLLNNAGLNINQENGAGNTAIHLAVAGGRLDITEALLIHGANPLVLNKTGVSPLGWAYGNKNMMELLGKGIKLQNLFANCKMQIEQFRLLPFLQQQALEQFIQLRKEGASIDSFIISLEGLKTNLENIQLQIARCDALIEEVAKKEQQSQEASIVKSDPIYRAQIDRRNEIINKATSLEELQAGLLIFQEDLNHVLRPVNQQEMPGKREDNPYINKYHLNKNPVIVELRNELPELCSNLVYGKIN